MFVAVTPEAVMSPRSSQPPDMISRGEERRALRGSSLARGPRRDGSARTGPVGGSFCAEPSAPSASAVRAFTRV